MAASDTQMKIRLPDHLKGMIEESARANNRSLNAEIVSRLQYSFNTFHFSQEETEKILGHIPDDIENFKLNYRIKNMIAREVASAMRAAGVPSLFDERHRDIGDNNDKKDD